MATKHAGLRKGSRVVIDGESTKNDNGNPVSWLTVKCDCGDVSRVLASAFLAGKANSCKACSLKTRAKNRPLNSGHPLYTTWIQMIRRCTDKNATHYKDYGGRGIYVCSRWAEGSWGEMTGFHNFVKDMGDRPHGTSLDRIDVNGNYEPGNCRWATDKQQATNRKNIRKVTVNNITDTIGGWAKMLGIKPHKLRTAIWSGLDPVFVVTTYLNMESESRNKRICWNKLT